MLVGHQYSYDLQSKGIAGKIDWVICGGESGPGARPVHPDWVRSIRDQCVGAGVKFFFKQWGEWQPVAVPPPKSTGISSMMFGGVFMGKIGKKSAGCLLDGRIWNEMPIDKNKVIQGDPDFYTGGFDY